MGIGKFKNINLETISIDGKSYYKLYHKKFGFIIIQSLDEITEGLLLKQEENYLNKLDEFSLIENEIRLKYENYINSFSKPPRQVWFTSDLHIGHTNVLKHNSTRNFTNIEEFDKHIIKTWNETVSKKDVIYLLGDIFWMSDKDKAIKLLHSLNGEKHIVFGNHDKTASRIKDEFTSNGTVKYVVFKENTYPFIDVDFRIFMSHYPMLSWNNKGRYSLMLHGHCHGSIDDVNDASLDLRFDVGWDGKLSKHKFISLIDLYIEYRKKKFLTNNNLINI